MEQESQMIQGTVLAVIYQNPENGYCVLKVRTEQGEAVTVVGVIPMCVVGERLAIVGRWTRHQSFGQQFEAEFLERLMPETTSEILAFLSSRAVKGIGPKMAEKIVSRFGEKSLNVLEQDPMQLTQIPGISEKKAQEMSESFQKQSGIRRLIEFLTIYHLPAQLAVRLYRAYGELAQEALRDDPYLLTDSYTARIFRRSTRLPSPSASAPTMSGAWKRVFYLNYPIISVRAIRLSRRTSFAQRRARCSIWTAR